jgi:hypothetical protein
MTVLLRHYDGKITFLRHAALARAQSEQPTEIKQDYLCTEDWSVRPPLAVALGTLCRAILIGH